MKMKDLFGILLLFLCVSGFAGCDDDEEGIDFFPEGTSTLRMMNEENGKTVLGNSDMYITKEGNFKSEGFPLFDMGEKAGIGDIDMPNFVNMAAEVAVHPKHGYLLCDHYDVYTFGSQEKAIREDADVYRVYVDSWIQDKEGNEIGANVYFLLGKPNLDEHGQIPAWDSLIGTLTWNYDKGETNTLDLALPVSNPNDVEVEFVTEEGEEYVSYSLGENSISFGLKDYVMDVDYRLRIRCGHIYTEVTISVR